MRGLPSIVFDANDPKGLMRRYTSTHHQQRV